MHRSPYFGQSVEFLQHREYTPGDDLRHVDWKVWAKQDRYYVKQYEEDTNLRSTLLVDVSHSMHYGSGPMNKYEYACTAAVSLAYLLLRQQDAVGCVAFDEAVRVTVPHADQAQSFEFDHSGARRQPAAHKTDLQHILRNAAESYPPRGMMVLISDLLVRAAWFVQGAQAAAAARARRAGVSRDGRRRADFPFTGPTRFEGLELPEHLTLQPARPARRLPGRRWTPIWKKSAAGVRKNEVRLRLVRTSDPLDAALAHFISNRMGMTRRA